MFKNKKLGNRISRLFTFSFLAVAIILCIIVYIVFRMVYLSFYNARAKDIVNIVAEQVDWERFEHYALTGEEDKYSVSMQQYMDSIKSSCGEISYLYIFIPNTPDSDHFTYVMEAVRDGDNMADIATWGKTYKYETDEYEYLVPDIIEEKESTGVHIMGDVGLGVMLSVWTPIFDDAGKMRAMVEADYHVRNIYTDQNTVVITLFVFFIICMIIEFIIIQVYLKKNLNVPLEVLSNGIDSYEHGKMTLNKESFKKPDELRYLAESFDDMTHRIEAYNDEVKKISAEKERISTELSIATQIQAGMLPTIFPNFIGKPEYELYAKMTPAKEVGGDFYDFFSIDDDHLALVIADVSGKGVPAALFMMMSMMLIKSRSQQGGTPAEILEYVNNQLCESNPNEMFVTVWLGIVDLNTGNVIASSAGHEFPIITDETGEYKLFEDPHGFVCGGLSGMPYENYEFTIPKGGKIFVYTDGVVEAHDTKDELFEFERTVKVLNDNKDSSPEKTVEEMMIAIKEFVGNRDQFDDITMISFLFKGRPDAE